MEGNKGNDNNRGMSDGCYVCIILSIIGGIAILFIAAFIMVCFGSAIWYGLSAAILYSRIYYLK